MLEKSLVALGHLIFDPDPLRRIITLETRQNILSETEFSPVTVYNYSMGSGVKVEKEE